MIPANPAPPQGDALLDEIAACRICAARFAATETAHTPRPVLQMGPCAPILIASQAPGARVQASGVPFNDPSGERLRDWLGVGRAAFYDPACFAIVPMAFCFPGYDAKGADLPPPRICAETWRARLMAETRGVRLTLLIGQYAQAWHLGAARRPSLTETVRAWRTLPEGVLALPHPSWRNTGWLKRNPWFETEVLPWLRARVAELIG